MIGWLRGELVARSPLGVLTIDVGGVGYELVAPTGLADALSVGETCELFVRTIVRDDAIVLYGFSDELDRETFDLLLATPGVGPATAIGALSTLSADDIAVAVLSEDVTSLSRIPGIGKKTAARLVLELSGKLPSLDEAGGRRGDARSVNDDLTAALRQLGYGAGEIREALAGVTLPEDDEGALRVALRQLGRA
jgi:Holliday junction DNA helicase RuvA